jgi:hypothetical protein
MADGRYRASESVITGLFFLLVGAGLTLLFGWVLVDAVLDARAFPNAPREMTVAEAASLAEVPRGAWVRLVDARLDCGHAPQKASSGNVFGLMTDATGELRLLVGPVPPLEKQCEEGLGAPFVGVLRSSTPGRIVGLDFPGIDWNAWPTRHLNVLRPQLSAPQDYSALWVWPLLMLPALGCLFVGVDSIRDARRARRAHAPLLRDAAFVLPLSTGASAMTLFGAPLVVLQLVVGTNLLPAAERERVQAASLAAELHARVAERRRYRLISLASLLLLSLSVASLAPVWRTLIAK